MVPANTKRLKISCLFLSRLAAGTVSHNCCKGYCLQDLRRPSFPFQVGLLQLDETASRREEEEGREEKREGERRERKRHGKKEDVQKGEKERAYL